MGLKYKNAAGDWVKVPIPSEIRDTATGNTTTYSSDKIEKDFAKKSEVPTKTSDLQNDSGYITADDAPPEVYIGSEEPQGNEIIWVDNSTNPENINATKAYVDEKCSEKWELINKISIDTQAVKIAITEDSHGNGFDLSKVLLICSFMPSELEKGLAFKIFTERNKTSNWSDVWGIASNSTSGINDKVTYMIMLLENIDSQVFKTGYWCSLNKSSVNGNIGWVHESSIVAYGENNSLKTFEDNFANRIMKKIDQIVLTSYNQTFGKGSVIKIYGIRK